MPYQILIVDDNKFPRKMLRRELVKFANLEIEEACNGKEALALIRERPPDLLFLDLTMPEMDGYQLMEQLQADGIKLQVVVVSADIQPKAVKRVVALGALSFLQKPASPDLLAGVLTRLGMI